MEQRAFDTLKQRLKEDMTNAYFDLNKRSVLTVDASRIILMKVIIHVSRSLIDVEKRHSQTERQSESLACVWCVERFRDNLFGSLFDFVSDC